MLKPLVRQLIKLGRKCPWAEGAGVTFLSSMDDLDVSQELDLRGQPLAALVARPLLLVAVEDAVLESAVAGPAVRGRESRRTVPAQKRFAFVYVGDLVKNRHRILDVLMTVH